jgi:hypothetical protein
MANLFEDTILWDFFTKAKKLSSGRLFLSVISQTHVKNLIIDLNLEQMRVDFMDSEGRKLNEIGGDYSPYTVEAGKKRNAESVDLYDTGYFHGSFKVVNVSQKQFFIDSDPITADGTNLEERYGEKLEGLTFENLEELRKYVLPLFIEEIKKQLA